MAWVKPRTSQDIPYVSKDNIEREVKGNLDYLKDAADDIATNTTNIATNVTDIASNTGKFNDASWTEPARAIDTVYENTSGKLKFVTITLRCRQSISSGTAFSGFSIAEAKTDSSNPPTTIVASHEVDCVISGLASTSHKIDVISALSFIVKPSEYYRVVTSIAGDGVTPYLYDWHEWDLH